MKKTNPNDLLKFKFSIGDTVFFIKYDVIKKDIVVGYEASFITECEPVIFVLIGFNQGSFKYRVKESDVRYELELINYIQTL